MAKKKTTKTKRAGARMRGVAKRATGMGRTGKPARKRATARRSAATRRTATSKRNGGGGRGRNRNEDMMTTATKTLRRAADTAMGIATTAIKRVRPR